MYMYSTTILLYNTVGHTYRYALLIARYKTPLFRDLQVATRADIGFVEMKVIVYTCGQWSSSGEVLGAFLKIVSRKL